MDGSCAGRSDLDGTAAPVVTADRTLQDLQPESDEIPDRGANGDHWCRVLTI